MFLSEKHDDNRLTGRTPRSSTPDPPVILLRLPEEILAHIFSLLQAEDARVFRHITRQAWTMRHVRTRALVLLPLLMRSPRWPHRCVVCGGQVVSHLSWKSGADRAFIPWCARHTDSDILADINLYCFSAVQFDYDSSF